MFIGLSASSQLDSLQKEEFKDIIVRDINVFYKITNKVIAADSDSRVSRMGVKTINGMLTVSESKSMFQNQFLEQKTSTSLGAEDLTKLKRDFDLIDLNFVVSVLRDSIEYGRYFSNSEAYPGVKTYIMEKYNSVDLDGRQTVNFRQKTVVHRLSMIENDEWQISLNNIRVSYESELQDVSLFIPPPSEDDGLIKEFEELEEISDYDGDGILNRDDQCPNTPGILRYNGCKKPYTPPIAAFVVPGMANLLVSENKKREWYWLAGVAGSFGASIFYATKRDTPLYNGNMYYFAGLGTALWIGDIISARKKYKKRKILTEELSMNPQIKFNLGVTENGLAFLVRF